MVTLLNRYLLCNLVPLDFFQIQEKSRAFPLVINGFRANPKDAEGHILFFDVEALITQMLTEEYSQMSPGTMEVQGFTNQVSCFERTKVKTNFSFEKEHQFVG